MTFALDIPLSVIAPVLAVAFAAGLARGFSGFGAALVFVPIASALIGPKLAVPLLLVADLVAGAGMVPDAWHRASRPEVATMAIGALVGVPAGAWALTAVDPLTLRWAIVCLVVVLLLLIASGWRYAGTPKPPLTIGVGMVSGLFSGVAQVGGPPVVAYWLGSAIGHHNVRANIVLYFAISSVISGVSYLAGGLISLQVLWLSVLVTPIFGLGIWLGSRLFSRSDELFFRRVCYGLIALAAILGLPLWDGLRG